MIALALTFAMTVGDLNKVTRKVNRQITYITDMAHYGKADKWVTNPPDNLGDCEDYALTKRDRLLHMGASASDMRIRVVDSGYGPHAILEVRIDGRIYVLDNLNQWAIPLEKTPYGAPQ